MRLRKLDVKAHEKAVSEYDFDIESEDHLYVTFIDITEIQHGALEFFIGNGTYRICGDDDYDFIDATPTDAHQYKNFEDFYNKHKAEYLSGESHDKREHKRVHEGLHDIIHFVSRKIKCNNVTATTTMLLQFGAYEFYTKVSKDDFEIINNAYFKSAASAMKYKTYFDGTVTKILLSRPAHAYANSRAVILDINRRDRQVTFYQTDFVFKTLENIHRIGFEGTYAKYGYELLISLALDNSDVIKDIDLKDEMYKLSSPTIDEIKEVIKNNNL